MTVDSIAAQLHAELAGTVVPQVLSEYGRRAYFPKGIVAQSQEAASAAHVANATAGVALDHGHYMTHGMFSRLDAVVSSDDMVSYAPTAGDPALRKLWWDEMVRKNPLLAGSSCSLPIVTAGLTHAIAIAADLFLDAGDTVVVPSPCWDNYEQIFSVRHGCTIQSPSLFDANRRFSLEALGSTLDGIVSDKIFLLLNFPNNPTGYTPTRLEMEGIRDLLVDLAQAGKRLVVVVDDAYFGLFHDENACRYSLFSLLWNAHENLLAVKCDAATKESLVWGFRVGFITYAAHGLTERHYHAMVQKTMGVIRSSVSSCSRVSQSLLLAAMRHEAYGAETKRVSDEMARRYGSVRESILTWKDSVALLPLPFNSGYFCTFACAGDAESLRRYLLENHGIGTVSIGKDLLRIAYSGVDAELLPHMIDTVYRSAETIWK
ncbi:MAG: hypothetical protein A2Y31_13840 [Spirochaetes bacterium GWC2_52_13]|nr:MAG: hypothetical protein A2Y31_13840 [Spirochaetes bacterium GWC2_52_13]